MGEKAAPVIFKPKLGHYHDACTEDLDKLNAPKLEVANGGCHQNCRCAGFRCETKFKNNPKCPGSPSPAQFTDYGQSQSAYGGGYIGYNGDKYNSLQTSTSSMDYAMVFSLTAIVIVLFCVCCLAVNAVMGAGCYFYGKSHADTSPRRLRKVIKHEHEYVDEEI